MHIASILQDRLKAYSQSPESIKDWHKQQGKAYNIRWAKGVQYFQLAINKDREKEGLKPVSFMAVRMKLLALKEISDLRWAYFHCIKYSKTKDKDGNNNSFSKAFWGMFKVK